MLKMSSAGPRKLQQMLPTLPEHIDETSTPSPSTTPSFDIKK